MTRKILMPEPSRHPPDNLLAIVVSVVGLVMQLCIALFWVGGQGEKVTELKNRVTAVEAQSLATNAVVATQQRDIAVLGTKLDSIKGVVDRVDGKLDKPR